MSLPPEFYISLVSDESGNFFESSENQGAFTNKLPRPFYFNEAYEVALTEIYIPPFKLPPQDRTRLRRETNLTQDFILDLPEINWQTIIPQKDLTQKIITIDLKKFTFKLIDNLNIRNTDLFKIQTKEKLRNLLIESFTAIDFKQKQQTVDIPPNVTSFQLKIPTPNNGYYITKIPIKTYQNFKELLNTIVQQIPPPERDLSLFVKDMSDIETEAQNLTQGPLIQKIATYKTIIQILKSLDLPFNEKQENKPVIKKIKLDGIASQAESLEHLSSIATAKPNINTGGSKNIQDNSDKATQASEVNQDKSENIKTPSEVNDSEIPSEVHREANQAKSNDAEKPSEVKNKATQSESDNSPRTAEVDRNSDSTRESIHPPTQSNATSDTTVHIQIDHTNPNVIVPLASEFDEELLGSKPTRLHMLFIYSDIVASHAYANKQLQLLRVIPYYENPAQGMHINFDSPEYYPLSSSFFDSISIVISNRGESISFRYYNPQPIYVQLHFRKKE